MMSRIDSTFSWTDEEADVYGALDLEIEYEAVRSNQKLLQQFLVKVSRCNASVCLLLAQHVLGTCIVCLLCTLT